MATFRNYEPRSEGLNAAYDLLLRAELAKAQAMGGAFAPLTDAIRSGQQMKIARDEQARLKQAQAEDSALRTQRMGLDTRELDLREKTLNRQMSQDDAFARAMAAINGPEPMQPAASGVPFQGGGSAAMTQRTPLSAGGLLGGGGGGQIDPSMLGAMGGENASRYLSMHNTMHDNALQDQKYADEQALKQREQANYGSLVERLTKNKVLTPEESTAFRMRGYSPDAMNELTTRTTKHAEKTDLESRGKAAFEQRYKQAKADFKDKPDKIGQLEGLKTLYENSVLEPSEREKQFSKSFEDLYGIGKEAKEAPGIDLPGIGQNLTLNTSLDRRKDGGAAYSVKDGQVVGLSDAEAGELNRLVDTATSRDRLFDDSLMMVIAGDKLPPEYQKNLDAAREVQRAKVRKDILDQLGWQEVDARWAGAEGGQPQSVAGGPSDDPGQNIANDMLKAVKEKKVDFNPAAMQKYLEENFTPTALRKVLGRSEAAANAAREDKIRKALAEGPGHKPPVKKLPSVGDAPPSWGKDQ